MGIFVIFVNRMSTATRNVKLNVNKNGYVRSAEEKVKDQIYLCLVAGLVRLPPILDEEGEEEERQEKEEATTTAILEKFANLT